MNKIDPNKIDLIRDKFKRELLREEEAQYKARFDIPFNNDFERRIVSEFENEYETNLMSMLLLFQRQQEQRHIVDDMLNQSGVYRVLTDIINQYAAEPMYVCFRFQYQFKWIQVNNNEHDLAAFTSFVNLVQKYRDHYFDNPYYVSLHMDCMVYDENVVTEMQRKCKFLKHYKSDLEDSDWSLLNVDLCRSWPDAINEWIKNQIKNL